LQQARFNDFIQVKIKCCIKLRAYITLEKLRKGPNRFSPQKHLQSLEIFWATFCSCQNNYFAIEKSLPRWRKSDGLLSYVLCTYFVWRWFDAFCHFSFGAVVPYQGAMLFTILRGFNTKGCRKENTFFNI